MISKKEWLFIGIGLAAGVLIGKKFFENKDTKAIEEGSLIQLGDKSKEVLDLQKSINYVAGDSYVPETGTYDKKTREYVARFMNGTQALADAEKGAVSQNFVNSLTGLIDNVNNKTL